MAATATPYAPWANPLMANDPDFKAALASHLATERTTILGPGGMLALLFPLTPQQLASTLAGSYNPHTNLPWTAAQINDINGALSDTVLAINATPELIALTAPKNAAKAIHRQEISMSMNGLTRLIITAIPVSVRKAFVDEIGMLKASLKQTIATLLSTYCDKKLTVTQLRAELLKPPLYDSRISMREHETGVLDIYAQITRAGGVTTDPEKLHALQARIKHHSSTKIAFINFMMSHPDADAHDYNTLLEYTIQSLPYLTIEQDNIYRTKYVADIAALEAASLAAIAAEHDPHIQRRGGRIDTRPKNKFCSAHLENASHTSANCNMMKFDSAFFGPSMLTATTLPRSGKMQTADGNDFNMRTYKTSAKFKEYAASIGRK